MGNAVGKERGKLSADRGLQIPDRRDRIPDRCVRRGEEKAIDK